MRVKIILVIFRIAQWGSFHDRIIVEDGSLLRGPLAIISISNFPESAMNPKNHHTGQNKKNTTLMRFSAMASRRIDKTR
jgi:hypothetical protein